MRPDRTRKLPYRFTGLFSQEDADTLHLIADLRRQYGEPNVTDAVRFLLKDFRRRLYAGQLELADIVSG